MSKAASGSPGTSIVDKRLKLWPCAPALVLPMLASFVGVITLLRYDVGANTDVFSALPMQEQTSISERMSGSDYWSDGERARTDGERLAQIQATLSDKFARWETLEAQRAEP